MQGVQPPARRVHVLRGLSIVQRKKLLPEPFGMVRLDFCLGACPEELLDTLVPKALYHPYSVYYRYTPGNGQRCGSSKPRGLAESSSSARQRSARSVKILRMIAALQHLLGWILGMFRWRKDLVLEHLALRQQLLGVACQATSPPTFDPTEIVLGSSPETLGGMAEAAGSGNAENRLLLLAITLTEMLHRTQTSACTVLPARTCPCSGGTSSTPCLQLGRTGLPTLSPAMPLGVGQNVVTSWLATHLRRR